MNDLSAEEAAAAAPPQPRFTGAGIDFFTLQLLNLLLTVITLGFFRFWAKTRYRRYLWSTTWLGEDPLEYRGTGLELLLGAILAVLLITVPFGLVSVALPALVGRASIGLAITQALLFVGVWYLIGVGIYRSWRYILSRTAWRGIRGGMVAGGWRFGVYNFGLMLAQAFSLGFATPWVGVKRWNRLTRDMAIGSLPLRADAHARALYPRFLLAWGLVFLMILVLAGSVGLGIYQAVSQQKGGTPPAPELILGIVAGVYGGLFLIGFFGALLFAHYHAAFLRETYGNTWVGETMRLRFEVTTGQVIRYYLVNMALVIFTFGIGTLLLPYRHWGFHVRRIVIDGTFDEAVLHQTSLIAPGQGEGIADAFDLAPF